MQESNAMTRLTTNIRRFMQEQELTVQELADKCGMRRGALSRIIHGHHSPTVDTVERIATALEVDIDLIFADPEKILTTVS
jgi:transcriptional regulator with XRE-family HTH domain